MTVTSFKIKPGEGAIIFRDSGVEFHYPKKGPLELRETFEFLTFAMVKTDWIVEWYEYLDAASTLEDLAGLDEETPPSLTLIEGGLIAKAPIDESSSLETPAKEQGDD